MRLAILVLLSSLAHAASAQPPSLDEGFRELAAARRSGSPRAIERAASELLQAVNGSPPTPAGMVALSNVAQAFAAIDRWETAERLWQRVIDEGMPMLSPAGDEQLTIAAADAFAQLARRAALAGDWARVVTLQRSIADSAVFARSAAPGLRERTTRALSATADALERLGRPAEAAAYLLRATERDPSTIVAPERLDHAAELFALGGRWREAVDVSERVLLLYGRRRASVDVVVRAHERIVRGLERRGAAADQVRAARIRLLQDFQQLGGQPGSPEASIAARAALALAAAEPRARIVARGGSARARIRSFQRSFEVATAQLARTAAAYERVLGYRDPGATLEARVAIGDRAAELAASAERARIPADAAEEPARTLRCHALRSYDQARQIAAAAGLSLPATAARALEAGSLDGCD